MKKITVLCIALLSAIITHAQTVTANTTNNVSCNGGTNGAVLATALGGTPPYTYLWTGGGTNPNESGLTAGTYTITVTDNLSNTATASTTVTQPSSALSASASATNASVCPGSTDNVSASPSGGTSPYTYSWTAGPFYGVIFHCTTCSNTAVVLPFGSTFTVNVTDNHGCLTNATVPISINPFPYTTISSGPLSPVCSGNPDTLIAVAAGATSYTWSNGATTSAIIVSPVSSTSYSVSTSNIYGCTDSAHYAIAINSSGNGSSSANAINVSPGTTCTMNSYSTNDSVDYFSFVAVDSNTQVIAVSNFMGTAFPHIHRVTLYDNAMHIILDKYMPDENGANEIRLDANHLTISNLYYIRVSRNYANINFPGNNPTPAPIGCDNASMRWTFQFSVRTVNVFVPNDSGSEAPAVNHAYYSNSGQILDLNGIPRYEIENYTNYASPAVYCSDSLISFVYAHTDTARSFIDSFQRVDMFLTGSYAQPAQRLFETEENANAGYLNYYLGIVPNGITNANGYSRLVYKDVYPNIDMETYSNADGVKLYFVCNPASGGGGTGGGGTPAGNPSDIYLTFKGASSVNVTGGGLNVVTALGTLSFTPGYSYEDSAGIIVPTHWQAYFTSVNSTTVKFNTGAYNTNERLIIRMDRGHRPAPSGANYNEMWSTYCGGNSHDYFTAVAVNPGNLYTSSTGYSSSSNFPTQYNFR